MFADSAKIFIKSGKGGDGHVSFRRERNTVCLQIEQGYLLEQEKAETVM